MFKILSLAFLGLLPLFLNSCLEITQTYRQQCTHAIHGTLIQFDSGAKDFKFHWDSRYFSNSTLEATDELTGNRIMMVIGDQNWECAIIEKTPKQWKKIASVSL